MQALFEMADSTRYLIKEIRREADSILQEMKELQKEINDKGK